MELSFCLKVTERAVLQALEYSISIQNGSPGREKRQQNPVDIPLPDWLIGILIMAYYNPHIIG